MGDGERTGAGVALTEPRQASACKRRRRQEKARCMASGDKASLPGMWEDISEPPSPRTFASSFKDGHQA